MRIDRKEQAAVAVQEVFTTYRVQKNEVYVRQDTWNAVFHAIFGEAPEGFTDPRWDVLFSADRDGYATLRAATLYGDFP